jgi:hypothetical protein
MIVTTPDCGLEAFLTKHSTPYAVARKPQFEEYQMVEAFYGNKVTRRSGETPSARFCCLCSCVERQLTHGMCRRPFDQPH